MQLSHTTDSNTCPTKLRLNALVDNLLPPEVTKEEVQQLEEQEAEPEVEHRTQIHNYNITYSGLNTL